MTTENDWLVAMHEEKERAKASAHAKGLAEGLAEGRAEGKAEGKAEGVRTVAKNLRDAGIELSLICSTTGLGADEVARL